jgi:hypothetical protein
MTEHLPECNYEKNPERNACICQRLRACEQRVLDVAREAVLGAKAIDVAHGRGLDEPAQFVWLNNALAAIDALREKSND